MSQLHIYRKSGPRPGHVSGAPYVFVGRFGTTATWSIPAALNLPEVAEALGEGEHELLVGFDQRTTGRLQYIKRKRVTVAPQVSPLRVVDIEHLD